MTAGMMGIILALQWIVQVKGSRTLILTDSLSELPAVMNEGEGGRRDLVQETMYLVSEWVCFGLYVVFAWIPVHIGIEGGERAVKKVDVYYGMSEHIKSLVI